MIFYCEFQKLSSDSLALKKTVYIKLLYTMAFYMNQAFDEFIVINQMLSRRWGLFIYSRAADNTWRLPNENLSSRKIER